MSAISSIPTSRLSNQFMALRMLTQLQSDQNSLFEIQNQLASGRRIAVPSDDAPAAVRAMTLQSLLERKSSVKSSLSGIQTRLSAAESAVGSAASTLSDVRALALSMVGSAVGRDERNAAVAQIDQAIDQLISIGNQTYQGSYLFAGSRTQTVPLVKGNSGIVFNGNDNGLPAYSDVNQLFSSNVTGQSVFGLLSTSVQGSVDLNPTVTWDVKLSDLNGGQGVRAGSISLSDGTNTSIVDISGAQTIGDVARMLEAHPPSGRVVTARVTSRGLEVSLDGGNLSIDEVGGGSTAAALGIKHVGGVGPGPVVGDDLNPRLTALTRLDDVLGSRARTYVANAGANNDLIVEAVHAGTAADGVTIKYVDDDWFQATAGLTAGNEFAVYHATATAATAVLKFPGHAGLDNGIQLTAATAGAAMNNIGISVTVRTADTLGPQFNYNATTKTYAVSVEAGTTVSQLASAISSSGGPFTAAVTALGNGAYVLATSDTNVAAGNTYVTGDDADTLSVHIDVGVTTAQQVSAAIAAEGTFRASLDPSEEGNTGTGAVVDSATDPNATGLTAGGWGEDFDRTSGLRIVNGGQAYVVDTHNAATIEDLLNAINGSGANVAAELNDAGTGIDVRSRLSGADFTIGENGGATATQLGIRSLTGSTSLASMNHGSGVRFSQAGADFRITRRDGTTFDVSLAQGGVASARLPGGANAGLLVSRVAPGSAGNQFQVEIVDSGSGGGNGVALAGNTLRFSVDVGAGFTAQQAIDMLAADATLGGQFTAQLDLSTDATNDGGGNLAATATPVDFVGGKNAAVTMQDVLDLINNQPTNLASGPAVTARLAQVGNGIELVNDGPGGTTTLAVTKLNSSTAAVDLGMLSATDDVNAAPVVGEKAAATIAFAGANNDVEISAVGSGTLLNGVTIHFQNDGVSGNNSATYDASTRTLTFDVDPATTTAQDLVDLLAGNAVFTASLTATDGGAANGGTGTLNTFPADATLTGGTADVLTGSDANPQQVDGVFTALIRLREAIRSGDSAAIQQSVDQLDRSTTNLNFARADLGARLKSLDVIQNRVESENVSLQGALSQEIDVDFTTVVSQLAARQASFQASLQVAAQLGKTTLLDYL